MMARGSRASPTAARLTEFANAEQIAASRSRVTEDPGDPGDPGDNGDPGDDRRSEVPELDVLVIGGSGVDTIVRVDELRVPTGDYVPVPAIRDYVAHSGNGAALGFHALGLSTRFIDYLGDDEQGALIRARYAARGLDFRTLPAPAGTPRSVNLVDRQGRRFSFYDGRHPDDLRLPAGFYQPHVAQARHVHVSRSHFNQDIFPDLVAADVTVSTDLHAWDGQDASAHPYAFQSDFVFMSAATVREKAPRVLEEVIERGRAIVAVATDGENGGFVAARGLPGVQRFRAAVPAPERPVVDSNGAGDAFATAFLFAWFQSADVERSVTAGALAGAFACGSPGTHEEMITARQLAAAQDASRRSAGTAGARA
jgi:acarbose 7IV-phosphotransferase